MPPEPLRRRARELGAGARGRPRGADRSRAGARALPSVTTQLDLGGIGVGYGLDRAGQVLRRAGIRRALLDVSGDCLAIGSPPGRRGWLVEIADPTMPGGVIGRDPAPGRRAGYLVQPGLGDPLRAGGARARHGSGQRLSGRPDAVQVTVVAGTGRGGRRTLDRDAGGQPELPRGASVVRALTRSSRAQRLLLAVVVSGVATAGAVESLTLSRDRPATRARSRSSVVCLSCQSLEVCPP